MEDNKKIHRTGTLTAGVFLIVFGILFLLKNFFNIFSYSLIFKLWPLIFIMLGIEMLIFNCKDKKFLYDKGAVFVIVLMSFLAGGLAIINTMVENNMLK